MPRSGYFYDLACEHIDRESQARKEEWDRWYATLPADLKRRLSLHDFKRLGDCFKAAFGISDN